MKTFVLYLGTLLALVGAGVVYAAASPSAKLAKQDRVYGGGQFGPGCFTNSALCFDNPRNFAVDGHAQGDGSETAGGSTYGTPGAANNERTITCLRIDGDRAVIGGVVVSGNFPGYGYVQYFVDRGGPGSGDRDLASATLLDPLPSSNWPAGFPDVCPSPTIGLHGVAPDYLPVDEGDVVVQDAPSD